ncbi:hypothetical protein DER45DRAFT_544769 [Fusarium avenaceum]|nr:hypothetical protein DER45DRAFT_544769 [Fusarium avenaceum]
MKGWDFGIGFRLRIASLVWLTSRAKTDKSVTRPTHKSWAALSTVLSPIFTAAAETNMSQDLTRRLHSDSSGWNLFQWHKRLILGQWYEGLEWHWLDSEIPHLEVRIDLLLVKYRWGTCQGAWNSVRMVEYYLEVWQSHDNLVHI